MQLETLLSAVPGAVLLRGRGDAVVGKVRDVDSEITPGDIFVAVRGGRVDGHDRVSGVPQAGLVVVERDVFVPVGPAVAKVPDTKRALPWLSARAEGDPGRSMPVIAVTGTNGKTSTTYMLAAIAKHVGWTPGIIGTTGHFIGSEAVPATHTTPSAPVVQALLAKMRDAGCGLVAMEASSIGLAAFRCDAIPFRAAVFTNLTRDHLDVHGSMEVYSAAKARLFSELNAGPAILNVDDPAWAMMAPGGAETCTFSVLGPADLTGTLLEHNLHGLTATISANGEEYALFLPMVGVHNLQNALGAIAAARAVGVPVSDSVAALRHFLGVPGRLQSVPNVRGVAVFVDYAHTDDALGRVLQTLRSLSPRRIITVFGCGGDRDAGKRPLMGKIVDEYADFAFVTSDNPRGEAPEQIIGEIVAGMPRKCFVIEPDRASAIRRAAALAEAGDVVLVAGKGHEDYQEINGLKLPFDDRLVAAAAFA